MLNIKYIHYTIVLYVLLGYMLENGKWAKREGLLYSWGVGDISGYVLFWGLLFSVCVLRLKPGAWSSLSCGVLVDCFDHSSSHPSRVSLVMTLFVRVFDYVKDYDGIVCKLGKFSGLIGLFIVFYIAGYPHVRYVFVNEYVLLF